MTVNVSKFESDSSGYKIDLYVTEPFDEISTSNFAFAVALVAILLFVAVAFLLYDAFVHHRTHKVVSAAAKSDAILSSLYPSVVRDRLFAQTEEDAKKERAPLTRTTSTGALTSATAVAKKSERGKYAPKSRLKNYLADGQVESADNDRKDSVVAFKSKPIADLFPATTIMFGDIAGFTAWSSVREPSQVFTLLETLYHSFDEIARRRRVFKVETVGDCYVAVAGLPDPQKDHAVIMCRFARDCLLKVRILTKKLEVVLGPDTGDLAMRIGLHSGPVTAGVLRGERSRFQLFGDTMNTASRMESNGVRDKIQISQETADLLTSFGKAHWFVKREDKIVAKGKGELQTYWLVHGTQTSAAGQSSDTGSTSRVSDGDDDDDVVGSDMKDVGDVLESARDIFDPKTTRLIDWNVDVLLRLIRLIVARRMDCPVTDTTPPNEAMFKDRDVPVMDEVCEIITLPQYDHIPEEDQYDPDDIQLDKNITEQLHDYVCNVAAIYRDNAFHNFEHASHVTMSVTKLLSRIVAPSDMDVMDGTGHSTRSFSLHDHTYGITADPITQFACVFSALIHDVDHTGVPNAQLIKENDRIAQYYQYKSVAEQNSVDLAWDLLMDGNYKDLRAVLYTSQSEFLRFRQLIVNSVMATDIVDKELKALRNQRWDRAFATTGKCDPNARRDPTSDRNRKATIVIEHLIQASDVAHTMQHWHIYRKWNERFFIECVEAFQNGRASSDPVESWYTGELGFFDFYIIPLARKLKECGVFGVASDEYLNYAMKNRAEWEIRGKEIVDEMLQNIYHGNKKATKFPAPKATTIASPQMRVSNAAIA